MPKYASTWVDYHLPTGQEFSVAVCGYNGKIRHMFLGNDVMRRMMIRHVHVENEMCEAAQHCLAMDCPLNKTEREHLLHMLDMNVDEVMDEETARQMGTNSTLDALLIFAKKMIESLPEELRKGLDPEKE